MKQKHLLKSLLLLIALMAGGSAWAEEETIASFSHDSQNGWTVTGADYATAGGGYYKLISSDASIVTPSINWSEYTDITITISARKFGGPDATQGKISVSQGTNELASYSPSGTSIAASSALSISPSDGTITISCPGASNSKGCGVQSIVIKGTKSGASNLEASDFALSGATALSFDLYNNADAQTISYTTSSTGAVTVSESEYIETSVDADSKTITVTPLKKASEAQTITVSQAADETYAAGTATFTVTISNSAPKTGGWQLTELADLAEGDIFVIVGNNGSYYALSNDNGTGSAPSAVIVTVENDEITSDVADNIKWNISGNATNGYTFYPNEDTENWLYCTNTNNGVRVGTNEAKTFVIKDDYLYHNGTSRYVGIYDSQDWRCYTSINSNIKDQTFAFYKYVDEAALNAPRISAEAVELAYDATSGSIAFTLTNPVESGNMTASTNDQWLTLGTVGETVPFTCEANDAAAERTATVTLTYTYDNGVVTKDVTVTQAGNPNVVMTIAEARAQQTGDVTTKGVVTSCSGTTAYIQDATAAICVYGSELTVGNEVKVSGTLSTYRGLLEITSPTVEVLSQDNTVTPETMTIEQILASDKQGWLVTIEEATVTEIASSSNNYTLAQDNNTVTLHGTLEVELAVGDIITVTGNIGCYNTIQIVNPTNVQVQEDTTPSIKVSETAIEAPAEGAEGTITVTYKNITEVLAEVQFCDAEDAAATYDWIVADIDNDNNVYYTIDANQGEERTAYMKVYALDDNGGDVYSYIITITQAAYVAPATGDKYELFTGELVEGDYVIYYDGKAMNTTVTSDRLQYAEVTPENNVITTDDAAIVWHIAKSGDYWTIYNVKAEAYAASTGAKNKAQMLADGTDDKALWTVTGTETYEFVNKENAASNVNANLRNNGTFGFACYATGTGGALSLYKKVSTETESITISNVGYRTYCSTSALDFSNTGLTAYKATVANNQVTFTEVTKVPAGQGVLLKGTQGSYDVPVIAEADELEGNAFVGVLEDTKVEDPIFVLMNGEKGVGFYKTRVAFTVGAHTAYLPYETGARNFIAIGEATAIEGIAAEKSFSGEVYNLQGQRVTNAVKGLYIVNGKKVVLK